jgi:hypothetical protein
MKVVFVLVVLAASIGDEGQAYFQPHWVILPIDGNPYHTMTLCQTARDVILKRRITSLAGMRFTKTRCLRKEVRKLRGANVNFYGQ